MLGYVKKKMQEYGHIMPRKPQTCPYSLEPNKFSIEAQAPLPPDTSPKLDAKGIKRVQQIVGSILYYARAVNMTVLKAPSSIAVEQTKAFDKTMARCTQLLDSLLLNVDAKVRMILNTHSNSSYLLKTQAGSHAWGHFFMGWLPKNGEPIHLNDTFHVSLTIMRFVAAPTQKPSLVCCITTVKKV